jgi:hypothetical protein
MGKQTQDEMLLCSNELFVATTHAIQKVCLGP